MTRDNYAHHLTQLEPRPSTGPHESEPDDDLGGGYAKRIKRVKTIRKSKSMSDKDDLSEDESPGRKKCRTLGVLTTKTRRVKTDFEPVRLVRLTGETGRECGTGGQDGGELAVTCNALLSCKGRRRSHMSCEYYTYTHV